MEGESLLKARVWLSIGIILAIVTDLALPNWFPAALTLPSALDALFLIVALKFRGAEAVFWSGLIGYFHDDVMSQTVGQSVMTLATISLGVQWVRGRRELPQSFLDQALSMALVAAATLILRLLIGTVLLNVEGATLATILVARHAATYLLGLLFLGTLALKQLWTHSGIRLGRFRGS